MPLKKLLKRLPQPAGFSWNLGWDAGTNDDPEVNTDTGEVFDHPPIDETPVEQVPPRQSQPPLNPPAATAGPAESPF